MLGWVVRGSFDPADLLGGEKIIPSCRSPQQNGRMSDRLLTFGFREISLLF